MSSFTARSGPLLPSQNGATIRALAQNLIVVADWFELIDPYLETVDYNTAMVKYADLVNEAKTQLTTIYNAIKQVQATLTAACTGANNDLVFTAVPLGVLGNAVSVAYVDPGGVTATAAVVVSGSDITVNLGRAASAINTTATALAALIAASTPASALVTVANAAANNGTGLVTAFTKTSLSGGVN